MHSKSLDIFAITEAWASSSDNGIIPLRYHVHRNDRVSVGGGVMIAVSDFPPSYLV